MPKIICEECKKDIGQELHYELKEPDRFCPECKSDLYSEYRFCSKDCLIKYLTKSADT